MGVKALLVQSPATSPWVPRRQWEPPSVALATIAAQTDRHDVRVADMVVWRRRAPSRFLETLEQFRPRGRRLLGDDLPVRHGAAVRGARQALRRGHPDGAGRLPRDALQRGDRGQGPDARYWDFLDPRRR